MDELPTSEVWDIVGRLRPRLKIDFVFHLPPEICLRILGYLDPISLISTACASRHWQMLAYDRKLWQQIYIRDGFRFVAPEVVKFEYPRGQRSWASSLNLPHTPKRRFMTNPQLMASGLIEESGSTDLDLVNQTSIFGPGGARELIQSPPAEDVIMTDAPKPPAVSDDKSQASFTISNVDGRRSPPKDRKGKGVTRVIKPSTLAILDRSCGEEKLNWQHIYTQRRRLETNWEDGKFTNFQLPHPHYLEEGHTECVYTIQHSDNTLVSGSRDKTIRVWNLTTGRLALPPLREHHGSVLCLQYDPDPEEDIIVSGSSDATVIIWRFSTGKVIQRLKSCHRESVLNVRFDKKVLVTCSKDKTIRIFNRRAIDGNVHRSASIILEDYGLTGFPPSGTLAPFTLLRTLTGHGAAVNAVQILGDEVVSASGDRHVKLWNWKKNTLIRTFIGHNKGIACVQYDGRRIVSGSSDNEVKIFDKLSGLEVASLRGHSNLVRTVQAGFGDLPYSAEEERRDAMRIDQEYLQAVASGQISQNWQPGRVMNTGSSKPKNITAYGAKLPPGGGGCRYSRIVTGSYDESIVIWRRDKEGAWKAQHTLRQEEGSRASIRAAAGTPRKPNKNSAWLLPSFSSNAEITNYDTPLRDTFNLSQTDLVDKVIAAGAPGLLLALQDRPELLHSKYLRVCLNLLPDHSKHYMTSVLITALQTKGYNVSDMSLLNNDTPPMVESPSTSVDSSTVSAPTPAPVPAAAQAPVAGNNIPVPIPHGQHPLHARVFKLQFDARRIICCSQTPTIVGWDFANGDKGIIEASRFFAPME